MNLTRPQTALAFAGLLVLFLVSAVSPNHYWDEYYYLFSVSRHSPSTLLSLEGTLSDGIFPHGFFSGKIGFVVLLRGILSITGSDQSALLVVRSLFAIMTVALAAATWLLLRSLVEDRRLAAEAAAVFLLLPLPVYFGFKVLSEVPSLLLATLGGWQFLRAIRASGGSHVRALVLASLGFGLAILTRLPSVLFAAGVISAALVTRPAARRRIATDGALALGGGLLLTGLTYMLLLDAPLARFGGLAASVTGRTPGALVLFYGVALFVQLFGIVVLASLAPPVTREAGAALVWLVISMLPYVVAAEYVEPRYFFTGIPALALLVSLGVRRLVGRSAPRARAPLAAALIVTMAVVNRIVFGPLMPYEIRESDYAALIDEVRSRHPGAAFVTPWVADYCYLATAFPLDRVVLAMSETYGTGSVFSTEGFRRWVGDGGYVGSPRELQALAEPRIYVGWQYSPTIVALDRYLRPIEMAYLDDPEKRAPLLNHLTPSWIWDSAQYRLEPLATSGAYQAFTIRNTNAE